ncbi:MAG TPA: AglZ/HisF2 family acetamidino modification protein [Flavipsychrobacter sp.]|nr:AglZ/HisF2 family acetamidino modification protein [Flavipsychrobacter sp.]
MKRRVRIIPVLLLKNGGLYKTVKFKNANYIGDPINTVKIFNEKEADELVVLDFTASADKRGIDFKKITEIAGEAFMPMSYGGGIKTFEDAQKIFDAGYEKVIINSTLFSNLNIIKQIADVYGAQAVVGAIDVKKNLFGKYKVYSHSGTGSTGHDPVEWAKTLEKNGVGEIIINSIEQDGTWGGYDMTLIENVANSVKVPVIACGGAANVEDFKKAVNKGASAVAAGSMFVYQKKGMGVLISFPSEKIIL